MWLLETRPRGPREDIPRLVNISERDLESSGPHKKPEHEYAILSHRWEENEEITFEEVRSGRFSRSKRGWKKIQKCLRQAAKDGFKYAWIDTCCIDKRSSAELQEAINSMYRWYERAAVCYAYLFDVSIHDADRGLDQSKWFTRGWTLQELLAPNRIEFYDSKWQRLGEIRDLSFAISEATGIAEEILHKVVSHRQCSVAQRMFWASKRTTTRIEDRAYSLLGIFDVNMPMLYGEGEKSFLRLQEEIIKASDDHSIFAWSSISPGSPGLLADSPDAFRFAKGIESVSVRGGRQPFAMTNRGLSVTFQMMPYCTDTYLAVLNCSRNNEKDSTMAVFLRRLYADDQYGRVTIANDTIAREDLVEDYRPRLQNCRMLLRNTTVKVPQTWVPPLGYDFLLTSERFYGFRLDEKLLATGDQGVDLFSVDCCFENNRTVTWDRKNRTVSIPYGSTRLYHVGVVDISKQHSYIGMISLAFDSEFNPVVFLLETVVMVDKEAEVIGWNEQSPNSTNGWNMIVGRGDRGPLSRRRDHRGLWALKGDRIEGLETTLIGIQLPPAARRANEDLPTGNSRVHVRLKRTQRGTHYIWDFAIY